MTILRSWADARIRPATEIAAECGVGKVLAYRGAEGPTGAAAPNASRALCKETRQPQRFVSFSGASLWKAYSAAGHRNGG